MSRHQDTQTFAAVKGPKGLTILARPFFDRFVSTLPYGVEGSLTWEPRTDKRTNRQNRTLWGVCYESIVQAA